MQEVERGILKTVDTRNSGKQKVKSSKQNI